MDRRREWDDGHRDRSPPDRRDSRRMKSPGRDRGGQRSPMSRLPPPRDPYDDYPHHPPPPPKRESLPYKILCVANLYHKVSDTDVRSELLREFCRFGDVSVKVCHDGSERFAYIYFRSYEEAREARHAKSRMLLFNKPVEIDPIYERIPSRRRSLTPDYGPPPRGAPMRGPSPPRGRPPPPHHHMRGREPPPMYSSRPHPSELHREPPIPSRGEYNNHHNNSGSSSSQNTNNQQQQRQRESKKEKFPNYLHHVAPEEDDKATRTLFVGNLEVTITDADLRRIFERYGVVEDIDVKRPPPGQGNAYAFIKFLNLDMAHRSKVEMSGQYIGKFQCKIGYGKATPTTRIWVGGLGPWTSLSHLEREFDRFGAIRKIDFVKGDNHAYIQYDSIDAAQAACQEMRGFPLGGQDKRLRVDFADPGPYNSNNLSSPTTVTSAATSDDPYSTVDPAPRRSNEHSTGGNDSWRPGPDGSPPGPNTSRYRPNELADKPRDDWFGDEGSPSRRKRPNDSDSIHSGGGKKQRASGDEGPLRSPSFEEECRPNNSAPANTVVIDESVASIQELAKCCPTAWLGGLTLKNNAFSAKALLCAGDPALVDQLMKQTSNSVTNGASSPETPMLHITQRLRLDPSKLEDVSRKMTASGGYAMLVVVASNATTQPNAGDEGGNAVQQRPFRNLVSYLKQKDAAGVISLKSSADGKDREGVLYAFPPCVYALDLLRRVAPNLNTDTAKEEYLVVVVVRGTN